MSESKESKINKAVVENKLNKYGVSRKTLYSIGSLVICVLFIVVLSVTSATFNKEKISTIEFWIDFVILAGLSIYGLIAGQQTGDDYGRNNPNGIFRSSLGKYQMSYNKIDVLLLFAYFDDWLDNYREKKLRKKIESILKDNGIHQMEVLDLDLTEVELLRKPFKKEWKNIKKEPTYFLTYTDEQISLIKYCMAGKIKVSKLPRSFFVDAFYHSERDMWESAAKADKKKGTYLGVSYTYRIMALLAMSILSAGLDTGQGADSATVWLNLMKRIFCVFSAFVWGIFVGFEIIKIDVSFLDFKTDVLNNYYQDCELKIYVPETIEEKARKNYEENNGGELDGRTNNSNSRESESSI